MKDGVVHGLLCDLVEEHALDIRVGRPNLFSDMPGDGLALAVGVGRQQDLLRPLGRALISAITFFLPSMTTYSGWKSCFTSMPMLALGRSLTCPTDALTTKPAPRYFLMVAALAGDSTITRVPLPPFLAAGLAVVGFLVLDGLAFFVAGPSVPDLTFLLTATSIHLVLVAWNPANPAVQFGLDQCRHDRRQGRADSSLSTAGVAAPSRRAATSDATIPAGGSASSRDTGRPPASVSSTSAAEVTGTRAPVAAGDRYRCCPGARAQVCPATAPEPR